MMNETWATHTHLLTALCAATVAPQEVHAAVSLDVVRDYLRAKGWTPEGWSDGFELWSWHTRHGDRTIYLDPKEVSDTVRYTARHCEAVERRSETLILAWWLYLSTGGTP